MTDRLTQEMDKIRAVLKASWAGDMLSSDDLPQNHLDCIERDVAAAKPIIEALCNTIDILTSDSLAAGREIDRLNRYIKDSGTTYWPCPECGYAMNSSRPCLECENKRLAVELADAREEVEAYKAVGVARMRVNNRLAAKLQEAKDAD